MSSLFNEILYRPLLNLAVYIYAVIPGQDFGIAIIILTIIIRFIFLPLSIKALKSQRSLSELQPKMNEIKEKYKNDKTAQSAAIMQLYKDNKVNPFAGCLPLLVQLPVIFALYAVFRDGIGSGVAGYLYPFVPNFDSINPIFLGFLDISKRNIPVIIVAGLVQWLQSKQQAASMKVQGAGKEMAAFNNQMLNFMPIMIIIIGWSLPAGLMLYIIATTVFSIFEQALIKKKYDQQRA